MLVYFLFFAWNLNTVQDTCQFRSNIPDKTFLDFTWFYKRDTKFKLKELQKSSKYFLYCKRFFFPERSATVKKKDIEKLRCECVCLPVCVCTCLWCVWRCLHVCPFCMCVYVSVHICFPLCACACVYAGVCAGVIICKNDSLELEF